MRYLQYLLLLIGTPLLWALILGFGMGILGEMTVFRPPPGTHGTGAWGSAYGVIFCMLAGGITGLICGLVQAITQIVHHDGKTWKLPTWIGIFAGVCMYAVLWFNAITSDSAGLFRDLFVDLSWGAAVLTAAIATLGGYLGGLISFISKRAFIGKHTKSSLRRNR